MIETQLRSGRLLRLRPGVYLDARRWPAEEVDQHLMLAHAEQVAHPGAVVSHGTAAVVWGLPSPTLQDWQAGPVTLTVPRAATHRASATTVIHRSGTLPPHHIAKDADGYAVTSLARTAIDLTRGRTLPESLVLLDAAARHLVGEMVPSARRADYANPRLARAAREVLQEAAATSRTGSLRLALTLADPRRETPIESLTAGHIQLAGLPMPEFQVPIRTPKGTFYPDFLWADLRLIGEADGAVKYADQQAIVYEKEREQLLLDLGYRFVRWLGKEIYTKPRAVMARIARALGLD